MKLLLEDAAEPGRQDLSADLEKMHTAAERFLMLIDDIVHFRGVEAGRMTLELESTDTSAMLQILAGTIRWLEQADAEPGQADHGRVLVVDDNALNRDVLCRRLERQGHTVAVATNGRVALEMLTPQQFDLVLLDVLMPEKNGC